MKLGPLYWSAQVKYDEVTTGDLKIMVADNHRAPCLCHVYGHCEPAEALLEGVFFIANLKKLPSPGRAGLVARAK